MESIFPSSEPGDKQVSVYIVTVGERFNVGLILNVVGGRVVNSAIVLSKNRGSPLLERG